MASKQAIKARRANESAGFYQDGGVQRYRPPRIGPKQEDLTMRKDSPFHTLAEAIEAGEPPLADKITGERDARFFTAADDTKYNLLKVERVFCTASGGFVIVARPRTEKEEAEKEQRHKAMMAAIEKDNEARIRAAMALPDYILIAWQYTSLAFRQEKIVAYYIPKTGPRYVYTKHYKVVLEYDQKGRGRETAKPDKYSFSRLSRSETFEHIKRNATDYRLCAPLWLLTSIPDPRPRFLCPVIE
jgi:hypothetical protein